MHRLSAALSVGLVLIACSGSPTGSAPRISVDVPRPSVATAAAIDSEIVKVREAASVTADRYLENGVEALFPKRCLLRKNGPALFTIDGDPVTEGAPAPLAFPTELTVVLDKPLFLRVVVATDDVRIALFVPRDSIDRVSVRAASLSPSPNAAASTRIAPGVRVVEIARDHGARRVEGKAEGISFEGWIDEAAIGEVYTPENFDRVDTDGLVAEATSVTAPTGEFVGRLPSPSDAAQPPDFRFAVETVAGAPAGFQGIHLRLNTIEIRGVVPSASYKPKPRGALASVGVVNGSHSGYMSDTPRATLRAGAGIYSKDGERVGVALRDFRVFMRAPLNPDSAALLPAYVHAGPFGFVSAELHASDLEPEKH